MALHSYRNLKNQYQTIALLKDIYRYGVAKADSLFDRIHVCNYSQSDTLVHEIFSIIKFRSITIKVTQNKGDANLTDTAF